MTTGAVPLVLTLALDEASQERFDALRRAHFPPERNVIPAHATLFHKLPGEEAAAIGADLAEACAGVAPTEVEVTGVRFLGRGVAYDLAAAAVEALRRDLAARWEPWLTPQDRQRWRGHVTVANKLPPERARALHAQLLAGFSPFAV